jgi:hypothetical protein
MSSSSWVSLHEHFTGEANRLLQRPSECEGSVVGDAVEPERLARHLSDSPYQSPFKQRRHSPSP